MDELRILADVSPNRQALLADFTVRDVGEDGFLGMVIQHGEDLADKTGLCLKRGCLSGDPNPR